MSDSGAAGDSNGADLFEVPIHAVLRRHADQASFFYLGVGEKQRLNRLGLNFLAAPKHDDVFFAAADVQVAVAIQVAEITRVQPAALVNDPPRKGIIAKIALHDVRPARQNLTTLRYADLNAR